MILILLKFSISSSYGSTFGCIPKIYLPTLLLIFMGETAHHIFSVLELYFLYRNLLLFMDLIAFQISPRILIKFYCLYNLRVSPTFFSFSVFTLFTLVLLSTVIVPLPYLPSDPKLFVHFSEWSFKAWVEARCIWTGLANFPPRRLCRELVIALWLLNH